MQQHINFEMTKLKLLKSVFYQNTNFSEKPEGKQPALSLAIRNKGEFSSGDTIAHFVQYFRSQGSQEMPFSLEVEFGAVFSMSSPVPQVEKNIFIQHIFPQLVFPYMREYVAEITRRGGYPPLLINMALAPDSTTQGQDETPEQQTTPVAKWIH
ncbi:MAG: protein-export chaperone SecB [Deltaproteobacteria bacterium]|jgi:preprotein translocase subunit SecB|nr:protein-export chaperone SecB [Deltaproteobacteria bacterium]